MCPILEAKTQEAYDHQLNTHKIRIAITKQKQEQTKLTRTSKIKKDKQNYGYLTALIYNY